jgi:hypothetical protein
MTTGAPPPPTYRNIFGGIAVVVLILIGFIFLGNIVKYVGAALTFIPAKLGLIHVVTPEELIPIDLGVSPTPFVVSKAGRYSFFTDNYDLLVINDAALAAGAKPWLKIASASNSDEEISVTLVGRGLAIYDTPLAKGRPVATFEITQPGEYTIAHPTRPARAYIVPDYTTGKENLLNFFIIVQIVGLILVIHDIRGALRDRKKTSQD